MYINSWNIFLSTLLQEIGNKPTGLGEKKKRFQEFAEGLGVCNRVPLLLYAYDEYRRLSAVGDSFSSRPVEVSCYSILISSILEAGIKPDQAQAVEILSRSHHNCGHGSDVEPPVRLAEQAFKNQPYSTALYDATAAYKETLRPTRSSTAQNVKRKLSWILWHDPRNVERNCYTSRMQSDIHNMASETAFRWQWLLRHSTTGLSGAGGKSWLKEGRKRLALLGESEFLARLDEWITVPDQRVKITPTGSCFLRLLVWYGSLLHEDRSLPILVRLANVRWLHPEPATKVISALAWLLRTSGTEGFRPEIEAICRAWSTESIEVERLKTIHFPIQSQMDQSADQEVARRTNDLLEEQAGQAFSMLNTIAAQTGAHVDTVLEYWRIRQAVTQRETPEDVPVPTQESAGSGEN
ncbi:hypothetical protein [Paludibaculum fermentans]|uniref:Uncharacterized protein n=1 Tax=Paludibaculum fermentans TaxID=1473598 RepID=A0A7S7NQJ3_PALFE|nr:hypothetical protein [Paludibaculum fermentans]QOY87464.1 hypothetical protein IRI77_32695 [Paludibaculum fermentans]